jgi:hypothetical protein
MKTFYTTTIEFSVELDPTNPDTMTQAAAWMKDMAAGKTVAAPEGMALTVDVKKAPSIVRRKE